MQHKHLTNIENIKLFKKNTDCHLLEFFEGIFRKDDLQKKGDFCPYSNFSDKFTVWKSSSIIYSKEK